MSFRRREIIIYKKNLNYQKKKKKEHVLEGCVIRKERPKLEIFLNYLKAIELHSLNFNYY